MHNGRRFHPGHEFQNPLPVPDVEFVMDESLKFLLQALLIPACVPLRTEEDGPLIIIHAMNLITEPGGKIVAYLGTDESRRTGDEKSLFHKKSFPSMLPHLARFPEKEENDSIWMTVED